MSKFKSVRSTKEIYKQFLSVDSLLPGQEMRTANRTMYLLDRGRSLWFSRPRRAGDPPAAVKHAGTAVIPGKSFIVNTAMLGPTKLARIAPKGAELISLYMVIHRGQPPNTQCQTLVSGIIKYAEHTGRMSRDEAIAYWVNACYAMDIQGHMTLRHIPTD